MRKFISNYILIDSTQHTNSVLCADNGVYTVERFEVETEATLYVPGAIVVAPDNAVESIKKALRSCNSLQEALKSLISFTAQAQSSSDKVILQISVSPLNVHYL